MLNTGRDLADINENSVFVDRQFLLFQLDFRDTALNSLKEAKQPLSSLKNKTAGLRFIDPVDYDDPSSPLYWRNVTDPSYQKEFEKAFQDYKTKLFAAIAEDKLGLRIDPTTQLPFINITELIGNVESYGVKLAGLDNQITFTINNPENLASRRVGEAFKTSQDLDPEKTQRIFDVFAQLNPGENDVLVIKTFWGNKNAFNNNKEKIRYTTEFIGFLTPLRKNISQGHIDRYTTTAYGLSKLFYTSMTVEQQALNQKQFMAGVELNSSQATSVYATQFNAKNTKQIFEYLVNQTLGLTQVEELPDYTKSSDMLAYWINDELFANPDKVGFQNSLFVLLTLYLIDQWVLEPPFATDLLDQLFPTSPDTNETLLLENPIKAIIEHGEHQTFNKMVASGFDNFFSQLTFPARILDETRAATFYDVFESREGIIIIRPPRYNKVEITDNEFSRHGLGTLGEKERILVPNADNSGYKLSRTADFYIKNEDLVADISFEKNDMDLETRVDAKFTWPLVGEQDFPSGHYTDGDLLIKYGLRTRAPISNPNVQSPLLGKLFSPIALAFTNAMTRKIEVTVKDYKPFRVGKLYYLESLGYVGYLVQSYIVYGGGTLSKTNLSLAMARDVVDRPISKILASENEIFNFGLCYLADPIISRNSHFTSQAKKDFIKTARTVLTGLSKDIKSGDSATIPMFKYLPTILDLIVEVEVDPAKSKRQKVGQTKSVIDNQQQKQNAFTDVVVSEDDICCTTFLGQSGVPNEGPGYSQEKFGFLQSAAIAYNANPAMLDLRVEPPAGVIPYLGLNAEKKIITHDSFKDRVTRRPVVALKTPFASRFLAGTPRNFKMSQTLINKLSALDFDLKFKSTYVSNGVLFENNNDNLLPVNSDGFPQLYLVGGSTGFDQSVSLFGATPPPQTYLNQVVAADKIYLKTVPSATDRFSQMIFNLPNTLKFNSNMGKFSNTFFELFNENDGLFYRLPSGHLMYETPDGNIVVLRVSGRYKIVDNRSGKYTVTPISPATITPEDGSENTNKSYRALFTTSGLYFISPYTDMTPDRMVAWSFDNTLIGFRTNASAEKLFKLASEKFKTSENDGHIKGNAVDLCPDYIVGRSQSALRLLPAFYTRFQQYLINYFQRTIDAQGILPLRIIQNAITIYPSVTTDASVNIPSFTAPIYHCEVTASENGRYSSALRYYGET